MRELGQDVGGGGDVRGELIGLLEREGVAGEDVRHKQKNALLRLPKNLVDELHATMHQVLVDDHVNRREVVYDDDWERRIVAGRLFEMLVAAEFLDDESASGEELLTWLHDPERHKLPGMERLGRNPDITFVRVLETGKVVVEAVGEAKANPSLDWRCFQQLGESGIRESLAKVVGAVNQAGREDLKKCGLMALAEAGGEVEISPSFRQVLILPAEVDVGYPEKMVDESEFKKEREYRKFCEMLGDGKEVEVRRSSFYSSEVRAMARYLLPMIRERYEGGLK